MTKHVWIIEMLCRGVWMPTVGCALTRKDALRIMGYEWEHNNPSYKFRVRKYVSAPA